MNSVPLSVVPDPNDSRALQAFVEAEANGVPITMLLDTGASRSSVPHLDPFTSLAPVGVSDSHSSSGGQRPDRLVRLDSLRAGPFHSTDLVVSVDPEEWRHPPLLSMDVLGDRSCWFRFRDQVIEVDVQPPAPTLPLNTGSHQMPGVDLTWDGASMHAGWDTGAGITVIDGAWAQAHPGIVTVLAEMGHGTDAAGKTGSNPKARLASCRIAGMDFPEQSCGVVDLSWFNGALNAFAGLPLIAHADWYMDFPGRKWCMTA